MNKLNKIVNIILSCILVLCIIIFIFLKLSNIKVYAVVSGSMEPTIKVGSVVLSKYTAFNEIEERDIITYQMINSDSMVTHRVVEINKDNKTILCKGDANDDVDPSYINYGTQYVGTLIYYIPYIGNAVIFLHSTLGKVISIIIITILLWSIIYDYIKRKKENINE